MFSLHAVLERLLSVFAAPSSPAGDLDAMDLRQWADLPPYHPAGESRAC